MVGGVGVCHPVGHRHGGADAIKLRQPVRDYESHSLNYGVEGGDCYGKGSANEGATCCTRKPYWGVTEKACDIDQYGAPPMDVKGRLSGGLHRKDILGCREEGVRCRPVWGSAHGRRWHHSRARWRPRRSQQGRSHQLRRKEG
jgi:hypothetical protein